MRSGLSPLPFRSCLLLALLLLPLGGRAQPSGGPYGPIQQNYALPAGAAHIFYVAPDGKPDASGATLAQPTTLETALARVVTGDAIVLRGGVYRTGGLTLNQGITLQPYADERPVLKGTQVPEKWEALREGKQNSDVPSGVTNLNSDVAEANPNSDAQSNQPADY